MKWLILFLTACALAGEPSPKPSPSPSWWDAFKLSAPAGSQVAFLSPDTAENGTIMCAEKNCHEVVGYDCELKCPKHVNPWSLPKSRRMVMRCKFTCWPRGYDWDGPNWKRNQQ